MNDKRDVIRPTDDGAVRLAKTLIRSARHGALAVLDPQSGAPLASRVGVATDADGAPIILVSLLAAHTGALIADPRCSLLLGELGKGDALAHPRISLSCHARLLDRDAPDHSRAQRRYLARNPKAKLYAGLADFRLFRLEPESASLNGGFGKAFSLTRHETLTGSPALEALAASEQGAVDHMNADHRDAIDLYAAHYAADTHTGWSMAGCDADGIDLVRGDDLLRIFFAKTLQSPAELRTTLVEMAKTARAASERA